jgi:hypothetical protein
MATYTELQTTIASELSRTDLTTEIQAAIQSAIRHYQRKLVLFGQETQSISTVDGTMEYSLASDFLAFERVEITVNGDNKRLTEVAFDELASLNYSGDTGEPMKFCYRDYKIQFYPVPDDAYTVTISYWKQPAAPVNASDETVWTLDAIDLIRHRAKYDLASNKIRDDRAASTYKMHEDETYGGMVIQRDRVLSNGMIQPTQF